MPTRQPPPNYDYTAKERKERERQNDEKYGFKRRELKAHEEDWPDIKRYAARKKAARIKSLGIEDVYGGESN